MNLLLPAPVAVIMISLNEGHNMEAVLEYFFRAYGRLND